MKTWSMLAAVLVLGFCASLVMAEGAEHKQVVARGKVTKIDGANITVQAKAMGENAKAPEPKTFATDANTVVTVGNPKGEKKTVADIKVDDMVNAILTDDGATAKAIVINPKRPGGDAPKKDGPRKDAPKTDANHR